MKIMATKPFETVHPMTYLFAIQSIVWGFVILISALFNNLRLLEVTNFFYPEPVTIIWSLILLIAGVWQLLALMRDEKGKSRSLICVVAKVNISVWVFALTVWAMVGLEAMIVVSTFNIIGFLYIVLSSIYNKLTSRV